MHVMELFFCMYNYVCSIIEISCLVKRGEGKGEVLVTLFDMKGKRERG